METTPAPDISPTPNAARPRLRTVAYCVVLAGLATVLMFHQLGVGALASDESQYAAVVRTIRDTGEWIDVTPYPPTLYFQKPPLYFWLTASTYDLLGGGEFANRAWSAACGVGAVVLTCVLGAMLFSPEIGAIGGLLLLLNRSFLLVHGARSGAFDALVTFLLLGAVVVYVAGVSTTRRRWIGWILIGALAGLASNAKPFIGVPMVVLLGLHAVLTRRDLLGPVIAMLALLGVASPWYLIEWHRHGDAFLNEMFFQNVAQRIAGGVDDQHIQDPLFYVKQITQSSPAFWVGVPAMIFAVVSAFPRHPHRAAYGLLACVGAGWIALFTLSQSKAVHYAYPVFPLIALMIVVGVVTLFRAVSAKWSDGRTLRVRSALVALLGVGLTLNFAYLLLGSIPGSQAPHVPWEMYKALEPAIRDGGVRVVFCGFPEMPVKWREAHNLGARDCFYLQEMRADVRTPSADEVAKLVADGQPALVVLARGAEVDRLLATPEFAGRVDARFVYAHQDFHVAGVNLEPVLDSTDGRYVGVTAGAAPGEFKLALRRPALGAVRLAVQLGLDGAAPADVKYTFVVWDEQLGKRKRLDPHFARHHGGELDVSDVIEEGLWPDARPRQITLKVVDKGSGEPVHSTVRSVRMTILPDIPAETHPRR